MSINILQIIAISKLRNLKKLVMPRTTCEEYDNDENDFIAMFSDKKLENLIYLDLSNCDLITDGVIKSIAEGCPRLETLNISRCENVNAKSQIFLKNLIHLDLSNCPLINGDALKSIAKRCPKLETLNISGCKNVNTKSLKRFKNLKKFVMSNITYEENDNAEHDLIQVEYSTWDFVAMFRDKKLENLTHLDLSDCLFINGDVVKSIAEGCPRLETLNVSGCRVNAYSLEKLKYFVEKCKTIKTLHVKFYWDNYKLQELFEINKNLKIIKHFDKHHF